MTLERIDRAERKIASAARVIYRAFLEPFLLEKWLPPEGMTGKVHEIKASEGGGYVMSLYHGEATPTVPGKTTEHEDRFRVVFDELSPGRRVVQRVVFDAADPSFAGAMKQTWTLENSGEETTVSVVCENVPEGIRPEDHAVGLNSSLHNLARAVEASV
jgi:uncharacterized protein YndB with AHSA1/START domain